MTAEPAEAAVTGTEDDGDESRLEYEGWRVVFASALGVFLSFASVLVYTFGVFLKPISAEFGWSRQTTSAAFGIAALTVAVCSPAIGYLLDRFGPRRVVLPSLAIFGCAFASLAWLTQSLLHLYLLFVVMGVVGNGTSQMAYARTVSSWFVSRRGIALAVMMSGGASGALLLPPLAQWLASRSGWRATALVLGLAVLVIGLPTVATFIRERPLQAGATRGEVHGVSVAEGLRSPVVWILAAVLFSASVTLNGVVAHLSALLTDRGVTPQAATLALSAGGAAALAGRLATGWLLDRFAARMVGCVLLLLASAGTLLLSGADGLAMGVVATSLIGFGMGGEADVVPYITARQFGLRNFSTLYSIPWAAFAVAAAVGPVLMGHAFDATGSYERLLVRLAGVTCAAAALMLLVPRGAPQHSQAPASATVRV